MKNNILHPGVDDNPILSGYESRTKQPGKFEGEPAYTPYFYDLSMDGDGAETEFGDNVLSFEVGTEDVEMFPELENVSTVFLTFRDDGFVTSDLEYFHDQIK